MLLTTQAAISGVSPKKNAGTVVMGGNVPAGNPATSFPGFVPTNTQSGLLGSQTPYNYITVAAANATTLYLPSGIISGTLVANDRDDCIMYYSQKRDLAGVTVAAVGIPLAGPIEQPALTTSGSLVSYPSGWSQSGQLLAPAVVLGANYAINATNDRGATLAGRYVFTLGAAPTSGASPTRV